MRKSDLRSTGSGWHHQKVSVRNAAQGGTRDWDVTWRTQVISCCYRQSQFHVTGKEAPVSDFDPRSEGGLTPWQRQCGRCGSLMTANVRIRAAS